MKIRIVIEVFIGALIVAAFSWWLITVNKEKTNVVSYDDPAVKESIAGAKTKVLIINIDGMTWDIAIDLVNKGRMPNLAKIIKNGTHGKLSSKDPDITPAVWTTIATGQPASIHGIDNFSYKPARQYREKRINGSVRKSPAIWEIADHAGIKTGVVSWGGAGPAEKLESGVFISDGLLPEMAGPKNVYPDKWVEKINTLPSLADEAHESYLENIPHQLPRIAYIGDRQVFLAGLEIMRDEKPDLIMVGFHGLDVLSHGFWQYRFPVGKEYFFDVKEEDLKLYRDVIEMHYGLLDRFVGGLLDGTDGYTVAVISGKGFLASGYYDNIKIKLNNLLERTGYLTYVGGTCDGKLGSMAETGEISINRPRAQKIFKVCKELEAESSRWRQDGHEMMHPAAVEAFISVRHALKKPQTKDEENKRLKDMAGLSKIVSPGNQRGEILWKKTSVWNVHDSKKSVRGLYINLSDREPEGIIDFDKYESSRKDVIKSLKKLRTENNIYFFKSVKKNPKKDRIPVGERDLPDILVEINPEAAFHQYIYRGHDDADPIPIAAIRWSYHDVSGMPTGDGMYAISGKYASQFKNIDMTAFDFAPTILYLCGLPVGADMPGEVKTNIFDSSMPFRKPVYIKSWRDVIQKYQTN